MKKELKIIKVENEKEMKEFYAKLRQIIEYVINELKRGQEKCRKIKGAEEDADTDTGWYQKLKKKNQKITKEVEDENESTYISATATKTSSTKTIDKDRTLRTLEEYDHRTKRSLKD